MVYMWKYDPCYRGLGQCYSSLGGPLRVMYFDGIYIFHEWKEARGIHFLWSSSFATLYFFLPVKNRKARQTEGENEAVVSDAMGSLSRTAADAGMRLCLKLWAWIPAIFCAA